MSGFVVSVIGAKGGVGKSLFAANFSFAYAQETQAKVLLLDFDQKASGDQNIITGLKSKKNLKELSEFNGVIDPKIFAQYTSNPVQNVSYIGLPADPLISESISVDGLGKTLKALPNLYQITVIDVGHELTPLALKALEFSTLILIVVTPDILALNQTKRLYNDLISLLYPKDMIQFVLNQFQNDLPVNLEVAGKQLGRPLFAAVPRDDATCVASLNKSQIATVSLKNSAYAKGVTEVVRKIVQKNVLKMLSQVVKSNDVGKKIEKGNSKDEKNSKRAWTDLKARIHRQLVDEMDLNSNDTKNAQGQIILKEKTRKMIVDLLGKEDTKGVVDTRDEMNQMIKEVMDEALALGPLEDLLADKECTEIMVVGPDKIYYEKEGKVKKSTITFTSDRQVLQVIERIVAPIGRRIDEKTPYVDARLANGSRVHAIIPPAAIDGCTITIRKFPENRLTYKDYVRLGSMTEEMSDFLRIAVEAHRNIVVSGGTGSGKTSLVNLLAGFIQANERIITCEDSAELSLPQDHVVRLETKPPSLEGEGGVDIRCLVKQTLRMRPNRIIVGECRGGEALDMLQAMGTGHDGSMTTVHSNNPRECIGRLETLVQYAETALSPRAIREMIVNSVHLIIQASRLDDGSRKITHITEIGGMQGDVVTLQDVFTYSQEGIDKNGKIQGKFMASGYIPKFIEKLEKKGYNIPRNIFKNK